MDVQRLKLSAAAVTLTALVASLLPVAGWAPAAAAAGPDLSPDRLIEAQECYDVRAHAAKLAAAGASGIGGCVQRQKVASASPANASIQSLPACGNSSVTARNGACYLEDWVLTVFVVPSGEVVGNILFQTWGTIHLNYNSLRWTQSFNYRFIFANGASHPGVADTQLFAQPTCPLNCVVASGGLVGGSALRAHSGTATYQTPARSGVWNVLGAWRLVFTNPLWVRPESDPISTTATPPRCDDTLGGGTAAGCVFPEIRPVHDISLSRWRIYALHIRTALQHPGIPSLLTRTMNQATMTANRNRACPRGTQYPRPSGLECDEYPFASTLQGAASQPYGGTFHLTDGSRPFGLPTWSCRQAAWLPPYGMPGPGGYSVCLIPESQNGGGGTDLTQFYYTSRVIDGERFEVRIVA